MKEMFSVRDVEEMARQVQLPASHIGLNPPVSRSGYGVPVYAQALADSVRQREERRRLTVALLTSAVVSGTITLTPERRAAIQDILGREASQNSEGNNA